MSVTAPIMHCGGIWGTCEHAKRTIEKMHRGCVPVMRCALTGKHPDDCRPITPQNME